MAKTPQTEEMPDRISYSLSRSNKEYGTGFDVHVSFSTNVEPGEDAESAILRASKVVEKAIRRKVKKYNAE